MTVWQTDGRRVRADRIDPGSGPQGIVLTRRAGGTRILRTLSWRQVRSAIVDGTRLSAAELQKQYRGTDPDVELLRYQAVDSPAEHPPGTTGPVNHAVPRHVWEPSVLTCCLRPIDARVIGVRDGPLAAYKGPLRRFFPQGVPVAERQFALDLMRARKAVDVLSPAGASDSPIVPPSPQPVPDQGRLDQGAAHSASHFGNAPIRAIRAEAFSVSSQGRTDWDALRLRIWAFDRSGQQVPVRGTLRATLRGFKPRLLATPQSRRVGIPATGFRTVLVDPGRPLRYRDLGRPLRLQSWTRLVTNGVTTGGANRLSAGTGPQTGMGMAAGVLLPLRRPFPEHDLRLAPVAQLSVQLTVPGSGVFEDTVGSLILRRRSVIRDEQLLSTGSPFFEDELTSGSRRPSHVPRSVSPILDFTDLRP